jgi:dihydrofolate synthase/folylpolyglutamate synthase
MLQYQDALDWLYSFIDFSAARLDKYQAKDFDLERMVRLMHLLGAPQHRYPTLHLAGTKGKGSVSAMCASALAAGGYKTGFYISPHLQDFRERFRINGALITAEALTDIVARLQTLAPQVPGITTFELTTAIAFEWFAREQVDVAVIEVGLGGRLDATNVIVPVASVITALSYDHMQLLGPTLTHIAGEKAGIIKPGVPVVSAPQHAESLTVLERVAAERGCALTLAGREVLFRPIAHDLEGQTFDVWTAHEARQLAALRARGQAVVGWQPTRLRIPLLGAHQVENAATAWAALQTARASGLPLSEQAIRDGLAATVWPGRFEVLARSPFMVIDGAQNRESALRLVQAIDDYFAGRRLILVFGASGDKDIAGMIAELAPRAAAVVTTQAVHPRASDPNELAAHFRAERPDLPVDTTAKVHVALDRARAQAGAGDVILATGSLFVVAEARAALTGDPMAYAKLK